MTVERLALLHAAAFPNQRPWSTDEFARLLESKHVFLIDKTQCFALGRMIAEDVELLTLATDPAHQQQGYAQRCLATFHHTAQTHRATRAILEVAADNIPARQLYEKTGYIKIAERPAYYRKPYGQKIAGLVMIRPLVGS